MDLPTDSRSLGYSPAPTRKNLQQMATRLGGTALLLVLALSGCASQNLGKHVYLKQHRASIALTQVLMTAELDRPDLVDGLYETEAALYKACAPLQEAGYRAMNDEPVDLSLKLAAYGALDTCASQTSAVEDLLWRIDPQMAGHFLDSPVVSIAASNGGKAGLTLSPKLPLRYHR